MNSLQSKYDEYKEVLATYRENIRTLKQPVTFLATANVALIGVALERTQYELLILASLILFILVRSSHRQVQIMMPVLLRGLILENQFGEQGLLHYKTAKLRLHKKFNSVLKKYDFNDLAQKKDTTDQINKILQKLRFAFFQYDLPFNISRFTLALIIIVMITEFGVGLFYLLP